MLTISNGITLLNRVDPAHVTTLSGTCQVTPETGKIQRGRYRTQDAVEGDKGGIDAVPKAGGATVAIVSDVVEPLSVGVDDSASACVDRSAQRAHHDLR